MFDHILFDKTYFDRNTITGTNLQVIMQGGSSLNSFPFVFLVPFFNPYIENNSDFQTNSILFILNLTIAIDNDSDTNFSPFFLLPLNGSCENNEGNLEIYRIGYSELKILDFEGIKLKPDSVIEIDTDLMTVKIDQVHDVSSLTASSEFFNFGVGTNELIFLIEFETPKDPRTDDELAVHVIWENRWL